MMNQRIWGESGLPVFGADRQAGLRDFWTAYEAAYDEVYEDLMKVVGQLPQLSAIVQKMSQTELDEQNRLSRQHMRNALLEGNWKLLLDFNRAQGATYAALGVSFREWFEVVSAFQQRVVPFLVRSHGTDAKRLTNAIGALNDYIDITMSVIGDEYLRTKEKLISQQQQEIRELSTPILQVGHRLLLLPIIGMIDTERARMLTEHLLEGIREHRAKVVVMDITGVVAVDSRVANHLLQTVDAARLMGAEVIVSGLSSHVAMSLVALGVRLNVRTVGDLQGGLEEAHHILNNAASLNQSASNGASSSTSTSTGS